MKNLSRTLVTLVCAVTLGLFSAVTLAAQICPEASKVNGKCPTIKKAKKIQKNHRTSQKYKVPRKEKIAVRSAKESLYNPHNSAIRGQNAAQISGDRRVGVYY